MPYTALSGAMQTPGGLRWLAQTRRHPTFQVPPRRGQPLPVFAFREDMAADHAGGAAERFALEVEAGRQLVLALAASGTGNGKKGGWHDPAPVAAQTTVLK